MNIEPGMLCVVRVPNPDNEDDFDCNNCDAKGAWTVRDSDGRLCVAGDETWQSFRDLFRRVEYDEPALCPFCGYSFEWEVESWLRPSRRHPSPCIMNRRRRHELCDYGAIRRCYRFSHSSRRDLYQLWLVLGYSICSRRVLRRRID